MTTGLRCLNTIGAIARSLQRRCTFARSARRGQVPLRRRTRVSDGGGISMDLGHHRQESRAGQGSVGRWLHRLVELGIGQGGGASPDHSALGFLVGLTAQRPAWHSRFPMESAISCLALAGVSAARRLVAPAGPGARCGWAIAGRERPDEVASSISSALASLRRWARVEGLLLPSFPRQAWFLRAVHGLDREGCEAAKL